MSNNKSNKQSKKKERKKLVLWTGTKLGIKEKKLFKEHKNDYSQNNEALF